MKSSKIFTENSSDFEPIKTSDSKFGYLAITTVSDPHISLLRNRIEGEEIFIALPLKTTDKETSLSTSDIKNILNSSEVTDLPNIRPVDSNQLYKCDLCGEENKSVNRYAGENESIGFSFHDSCLFEVAQKADEFFARRSDEVLSQTI